jgi:hypothetical protein
LKSAKYIVPPVLTTAIGIAFFALYAAFPTKMHFVDGIVYAYNLENFPIEYEWHPHHPIWLPMMQLLFDLTRSVIPGIRSIAFLSFTNAILGGIAVPLFIKLVTRITNNYRIALWSGIFWGITWGMMTYCSDANIYILILVLILLASIVLLRGDNLSSKDAILATAIVIIASLMHQMTFFFTFAVLAVIIIRSQRKSRFKNAVSCIAIYSIIVIAVNYLVYSIAKPVAEIELETTFLQWLTAYGSTPTWWTIFKEGLIKAQEIFYFSQMNAFLFTPDSGLIYHARAYKVEGISPFFAVFHFLIVATVIYEIIDLFRNKAQERFTRQSRIFMLFWFMPYFIFNQFYCAFEPHYKLFFIPPLIVLWALRFHTIKPGRFFSIAIPVMIVLLGIWNLSFGMIPNSRYQSNPYLVDALDIGTAVEDGDLVLMSITQFYLSSLTRYYSDADSSPFRRSFGKFSVVEKGFMDIDAGTVEFLNNRYKRILVTDEAFRSKPRTWYFAGVYFPPPHPPLLALHPLSVEKIGEVETDSGRILHVVKLNSVMKYRSGEAVMGILD